MSHAGLLEEPRPFGVSEKKQLSHDAYTVGWICVLQCELNAAKALLDEQHEQLPSAAKDDNSYLLGHYGTNAAAQTAVHMIRTFSNIRFGLLVGVGGGAPNRPDPDDPFNDLRLGDVVVGVAKGSHGGVLQYDMGKWKNDTDFPIESHLNKPPKVLSKAIELLQSEHDFGEGHMSHYIHQMALKAAKLRGLRQYRFPGRDKDQLFSPAYRHVSEADCLVCDPAQLVERLPRDSDDPIVHYGLIASGNAVLRSAKRRDELRDAWGVLCFEMEAAGLMENFPCIVIRGICDYSDDHKNKVWQPYSAVVAAAYAKDLLRVIQPQEVENMDAIKKPLEKLFENFATTREAVKRIESKITSKEDIEILEWLTPVNYGLQQSDCFQRRHPGTGQWLLNSAEYQEWLHTSQQTLFCQGIPGSGKTILTSMSTAKAKIFATARHIQDIRNEFDGSILLEIHQIANAVDGMFLFAKLHLDSLQHKPTPKAIFQALDNLPKGNEGLNETYGETMRRIRNQGQEFQQLALRALAWITCAMRQLSTFELQTALAVEKDSSEMDEDNIPEIEDIVSACAGLVTVDKNSNIVRLVHHTTQEYFQRTQKDWFPDAQNEITSACITYLSFDIFSTGFNPLYSYAAENWGHHARDSINLDLTANALFKSQSRMEAAWANWVTELHLTAYFGLEDFTKQLICEYDINSLTGLLETPLSLSARNGHGGIVKLLLEVGADVESKDINGQTALTHAARNGYETIVKLLLMNGADVESEDETGWTVLMHAAMSGYEVIVKLLLQTGANFTPRDAHGQTALTHAAMYNHEAVVKLLLKNGAGLESKDEYGQTALTHVARNGYEAIVKLLLEAGADLESKDIDGQTALMHAANSGHEATVKMLLEKGADIESVDEYGWTALGLATMRGHPAIIKLLATQPNPECVRKRELSRAY
ncbi:ankyrin repeats (3 copies) domain-containing protein [Trichoderma breve]|uniref:Ankyrin repeats (3 copies) domain-containing protein n=1 Tax=Trichoderma breve TaxID=2034170 RepID=A0A9W9B7U1_9HYPO|nr:ankyrin repeats (3 copies) domain-containing protein [Trichoderma breve]KAJ4855375.1 ankyrin repeats (3 copies) domain-containing protein [Trichoderma breve]